ncbi:MAG: Crp/Fnr family transcriptional regulator [Burkholderiaceae bacterium]
MSSVASLSAASEPLRSLVGDALLGVAREQRLDPGQTLFRAGDVPDRLFALADGEVVLCRVGRNGESVVLQRCRRGFIAEASVDTANYHCSAVARRQSRLLAIPLIDIREALDVDPAFRRRWLAHLSRELRRLREVVERRGLRSAAERIRHYIECEGRAGSLALDQSRRDWAEELGLTPESLYRTLAAMRRSGTLRIDGTTLSLDITVAPSGPARVSPAGAQGFQDPSSGATGLG